MGLTPKERSGLAIKTAQDVQVENKLLTERVNRMALRLAESSDQIARKDNFMLKVGMFALMGVGCVLVYDLIAPVMTWQTQPGLGWIQLWVMGILGVSGTLSILYALL